MPPNGAVCAFICETCGSRFTPSVEPSAACPICEDERRIAAITGDGSAEQY